MVKLFEYHVHGIREDNILRRSVSDCLCLCHIPMGLLCRSPYCCEKHWSLRSKYGRMEAYSVVQTSLGYLGFEELFLGR